MGKRLDRPKRLPQVRITRSTSLDCGSLRNNLQPKRWMLILDIGTTEWNLLSQDLERRQNDCPSSDFWCQRLCLVAKDPTMLLMKCMEYWFCDAYQDDLTCINIVTSNILSTRVVMMHFLKV